MRLKIIAGETTDQGAVVAENYEVSPIEAVVEMSHGQLDCHELPAVSTLVLLLRFQHFTPHT